MLSSSESTQRSPVFKSLVASFAGALVCKKVLFFLFTVDVKLVISVDKAESALALVVCYVAILAVFVFTVLVKVLKLEAVELCAFVTVTISACAVAIAPVIVLPV